MRKGDSVDELPETPFGALRIIGLDFINKAGISVIGIPEMFDQEPSGDPVSQNPGLPESGMPFCWQPNIDWTNVLRNHSQSIESCITFLENHNTTDPLYTTNLLSFRLRMVHSLQASLVSNTERTGFCNLPGAVVVSTLETLHQSIEYNIQYPTNSDP